MPTFTDDLGYTLALSTVLAYCERDDAPASVRMAAREVRTGLSMALHPSSLPADDSDPTPSHGVVRPLFARHAPATRGGAVG